MSQIRLSGMAILFAVALTGCSSFSEPRCSAGLKPVTEARLFFGRAIPGGGSVSDAEWQRFVDEEVTPRFPDGLSVIDGSGQWRDGTGIVREPSKVLIVVLTGHGDEQTRLEAVRGAYRERFHQESVLMTQSPVCGGF